MQNLNFAFSKFTLPLLLNLGFRYCIPGNLKDNTDSQMWLCEFCEDKVNGKDSDECRRTRLSLDFYD